jgi:hypothetical protein
MLDSLVNRGPTLYARFSRKQGPYPVCSILKMAGVSNTGTDLVCRL